MLLSGVGVGVCFVERLRVLEEVKVVRSTALRSTASGWRLYLNTTSLLTIV